MLKKYKNSRPQLQQESNLAEEVTKTSKAIAFVGATGAGKSTSLNVIVDPGNDTAFAEAPRGSVKPMTTLIQRAELPEEVYDQRIALVDTPGINDARDFRQQKDLFLELRDLSDVAVVVFCCPFNVKDTPELQGTMRYYAEVFKPVMKKRQFGLLLTHINGDEYEQMMHDAQGHANGGLDDVLATKAKNLSDILGGAVEFSFAWAMGKIFPFQRERVLESYETFLSQSKAAMHDRWRTRVYPENIGVRSLETRMKLLLLAAQSDTVSFAGHLFPLPPALEAKRQIAQDNVNRLLKSTEDTIAIAQPQVAVLLKSKTTSEKMEQSIRTRCEALERQIAELQAEQSATYTKGMNDMVVFGRYERQRSLNIPIKPHKVVDNGYQCKMDSYSYSEEQKCCVFDVVPDFLNVKKGKLGDKWFRWYCHLTFKWDGSVANKDMIDLKTDGLRRAKGELNDQVRETSAISAQYEATDEILNLHEAKRKKLTDDLDRLRQSMFKVEDLDAIVATLELYTGATQQN